MMQSVDLPLQEKVKLIHSIGNGESQNSLATAFHISVGAVNNTINKKRTYLEAFVHKLYIPLTSHVCV